MPGWAIGSVHTTLSAKWFRQMKTKIYLKRGDRLWQDVDLYIGSSEHATGEHLLYSVSGKSFVRQGVVPKPEFDKKT